jgi:hypothetical protein
LGVYNPDSHLMWAEKELRYLVDRPKTRYNAASLPVLSIADRVYRITGSVDVDLKKAMPVEAVTEDENSREQ